METLCCLQKLPSPNRYTFLAPFIVPWTIHVACRYALVAMYYIQTCMCLSSECVSYFSWMVSSWRQKHTILAFAWFSMVGRAVHGSGFPGFGFHPTDTNRVCQDVAWNRLKWWSVSTEVSFGLGGVVGCLRFPTAATVASASAGPDESSTRIV